IHLLVCGFGSLPAGAMARLPGTSQRNIPARKTGIHGPIAIFSEMVYSALLTGKAQSSPAFHRGKTIGMKILQITRQYAPSTGGLASAVEGLSRAVQEAGHEVRIVTLKKIFETGVEAPAESIINGVNVSRIGHWGS